MKKKLTFNVKDDEDLVYLMKITSLMQFFYNIICKNTNKSLRNNR